LRRHFVEEWSLLLAECLGLFLPELGPVRLEYGRGWPNDLGFEEALKNCLGRDMVRGHTSFGPHRADWSLSFARAPRREHLSRGQAKLAALACVLSQAQVLHLRLGAWPVICLDDLASELDASHQAGVLHFVAGTNAQILLSGVEEPAGLSAIGTTVARFHVEQGGVKPLLL
jgi:DNA replication and repair protein RecF